MPQFEITAYYYPVTYHSIGSVQLKGGYWDQNIRNPGSFLPRAGGVNFSNVWNQVNRTTTRRVYLESWNEYDEGSGLYAGTNLPPYIAPANTSGNTDIWSAPGDPFEYIKTTAAEANYKLGQADADASSFVATRRVLLSDAQDEIPVYGGIFRGRPKVFTFTIRAPSTSGVYTTHWQMLQENVTWFGEMLVVNINVDAAFAPKLTIIPLGANIVLTWPTNNVGYTLQYTTNLVSPSSWTTNSPGPIIVSGQNTVTNSISGTPKFYRLIQY